MKAEDKIILMIRKITLKDFNQSVLITNFDELWNNLKASYRSELPQITFSKIPNEKKSTTELKC